MNHSVMVSETLCVRRNEAVRIIRLPLQKETIAITVLKRATKFLK